MPQSVTYIVVPFIFARHGKLSPGSPRVFATPGRAIRSGKALGATNAGTIVLEQKADAERDLYEEPRLIAHFGQVPQDMFQLV